MEQDIKCARLEGGFTGMHMDGIYKGNYTVRNGMHACPYGEVMTGFFKGWQANIELEMLACAKPSTPITLEMVDGNPASSDGRMHVCPEKDILGNNIVNAGRFAMTGIHVGNNKFSCAR